MESKEREREREMCGRGQRKITLAVMRRGMRQQRGGRGGPLSHSAVKPSEATNARSFSEVTKRRCGGILIPRARRLQAQLSSIGLKT